MKEKNNWWSLLLLAIYFVSELSFSKTFFDENISADQAYEYGRVLRAQYRNKEAREYLKFAFENGSADGAYLYALELKRYNQTVRTDYQIADYIRQAARLGNIKAIRYLSLQDMGLARSELSSWRKQYSDLLAGLIEKNEAAASFEYFLFYRQLDKDLADEYLDSAVELNHPIALMVKGDLIKQGGGFYLFDFSRNRAIMKYYRKAAETNYFPAIKKYIYELEKTGKKDLAFEWLLKAANRGDLSSVAVAARTFAGLSETYKSIDLDLIKAKAYYDIYFEVAGNDRFSVLYEMMLAEYDGLVKDMDDEQLAIATEKFGELKGAMKAVYSADIYWFDDGYFYSFLQ